MIVTKGSFNYVKKDVIESFLENKQEQENSYDENEEADKSHYFESITKNLYSLRDENFDILKDGVTFVKHKSNAINFNKFEVNERIFRKEVALLAKKITNCDRAYVSIPYQRDESYDVENENIEKTDAGAHKSANRAHQSKFNIYKYI